MYLQIFFLQQLDKNKDLIQKSINPHCLHSNSITPTKIYVVSERQKLPIISILFELTQVQLSVSILKFKKLDQYNCS